MVGGGLAQALPNYHLIGWVFVAVGVLIMLWGVRINDRPLWELRRRAPKVPVPESKPFTLFVDPESEPADDMERTFKSIHIDGWTPLLVLRDRIMAKNPAWICGAGQEQVYDVLGALRQAAADGAIHLRGRRFDLDWPYRNRTERPLVTIPADHLKDHTIFFGSFVDPDTNYGTFIGANEWVPGETRTHRDIEIRTTDFDRWIKDHGL